MSAHHYSISLPLSTGLETQLLAKFATTWSIRFIFSSLLREDEDTDRKDLFLEPWEEAWSF